MSPLFLGISGSIRPGASSTRLLEWLGQQLSATGHFHIFEGLAAVAPFDGREPVPDEVEDMIAQIRSADFVIFCSPEYAHGVPGVLKNALDWTVASDVWIDKPVAVITAAGQGEHAHASLIEILSTMTARIVPDASLLVPFVRAKINMEGRITDMPTADALMRVVDVIRTFTGRDNA